MPKLWFGDDHDGNDFTATATDWISVTLPRPVARTAMNGQRPFAVKKMTWKVCSAPSLAHKMYARISTADGSVFDNSYMGQTISWQKAAAVMWAFQAINLHFPDDGGQKLRAWLVSGGPFYFARNKNASGTIQTTGSRQFSGTPVGNLDWVQVAKAPTGLKVARDPSDANHVTFSWKEWDVKKNPDECGDSTSLMGYCVQVAKDPDFTEKTRLLYVSKGAGEAYGLYAGYDWYFRIATRNEVSEKYKLPGGQWSDGVKLAAQTTAATPAPTTTAAHPASARATRPGSVETTGTVSDANPNSDSNSGGASGTTAGTTTIDVTEDVTNTVVKQAKDQLAGALPFLQDAATAAHTNPSPDAWNALANQLVALKTFALQLQANAPVEVRGRWATAVSQIDSTRTKVLSAATAAGAAQSAQQKIDAAVKAAMVAVDGVYNEVVAAKKKNTATAWKTVALRLDDLAKYAAAAAAATRGTTQSAWNAAKTSATTAATLVRAAVLKFTNANVEKGRAAAQSARDAARTARDATAVPTTDYSMADDGTDDLSYQLNDLLSDTEETTQVTRTVVVSTGTTLPTDSGDAGGSTPTPVQTETGTQVVFTPIPDTSALRSKFGGLLLSRSPRTSPGHTVYLMDRGGRARIGEFKDPSVVEYNRIRDDQSLASVTFDGEALKRNKDLFDKLAVGRHELLIYRGSERVWEGPATLATFRRSSVQIRAHDVTHYLNRTVLKNAYSNAYPALDYVVNRIAGIIASELVVKEAIDPPINVLPFVRTYVMEGDARTTRVSLAAEATVWQHLDDLAARAGIDYTVIGRSIHIWDTSRAALGRLRKVTEADFLGDAYIGAYGMETATQTFVSDGQGNFGHAGGVDDFYGEIDLLATAYDENGNAVNSDDNDPSNDTVPIAEMDEQASRNLKGRNPTPLALKVPDGSSFRMDRGIGLDVLIPGVYIPVSASLGGRTLEQMMKLTEVKVRQDSTGEQVSLTLTPASGDDNASDATDEG